MKTQETGISLYVNLDFSLNYLCNIYKTHSTLAKYALLF